MLEKIKEQDSQKMLEFTQFSNFVSGDTKIDDNVRKRIQRTYNGDNFTQMRHASKFHWFQRKS